MVGIYILGKIMKFRVLLFFILINLFPILALADDFQPIFKSGQPKPITILKILPNRWELAQQLKADIDFQIGRDFARSRRRMNSRVGYRPIIQILPEGVNMSVSAVISGDRRYVRFRLSPMFSQIKSVYTFNFSNGQSSQIR